MKNKTKQITLNLSESVIQRIEDLTGESIEKLLEREINNANGEIFIELMGFDNY
jgi:hypothetical protein